MDFLDDIFLDNTVKNYLSVCSVIVLVLLFKRFLSHKIASLLFLVIHKKWKSIERHHFLSLTIKPLGWLLIIVVSVLTIEQLNYPLAWEFKIHRISIHFLIEKISEAAIIIAFFYFVISLIDFVALLLEQNAVNNMGHGQVIVFFRDLLKVFVAILGLLFIIRAAFNKDIGTLLTGLSIVGAALALAAKESIENLIASFIIFFDKPFYTGDTLKVNNVTGTVERIGLRSTRIRTGEKTLVTVPNKQMVDSVVDNWSMRDSRRAEIKLELSAQTTATECVAFTNDVKAILENHKNKVTSYSVFVTDYTKNGIIITTEFFANPIPLDEFTTIKQSIIIALLELVQTNKIGLGEAQNSITILNTEHNAPTAAAPTSKII